MRKRITPLSDIQVKNKKPADKDYKLSDGQGLYLLVNTTGGKLWRLDYTFSGKRRTLSFGSYPALSLADARQRRDDAKKLLANGVDPGEFKKSQKAAKQKLAENSFEIIAREWHCKYSGEWSSYHLKTIIDRLEKDIFPYIGSRPIAEIKAPELLTTLRRIESRGALDTAHRVRANCGAIFRYAVATGRAERDPTGDLKGALPPAKFGHRAAPTDPKDVAPLLRAVDGYEGSPVVRAALQMLFLTFVRPGELRAAEWKEFDLEAATWSIPGHRMKMKEPHLVPLCKKVISILKEIHPLTGHSIYVFPCHRSPLRCMSENAINAALRRMGFEKEEITGHGARAMARTMLHEILNFEPDVIEAQLAHAVPDRLGRAYNRTQHIKKRTEMMNTWAKYLDGLKSGAKVIPFKTKAA